MNDKSRLRVSTTRRFLFYTTVLYICIRIYIYKISQLYQISTIRKNSSPWYQTIFDHMFSDPKSDHTFHIFWLRYWIIFCLFIYVEIYNLLRRQEGVGIHFKLITY